MSNPNDKRKEWIFDNIGTFGLWQKKVFIFVMTVHTIGIWQNFAITFMAPNMAYRCITPNITLGNSTEIEILNATDECHIVYARRDGRGNTSVHTLPCTQWEYDTSEYSRTIVNEWNLVCDREWMVSFAKSIYMIGFLISVLVFGQISDYFGRFRSSIACYVITCISSTLSCFSTSYLMFVVMRFFTALGRTSLSIIGYVLLMEITGPERRTEVGVAIQFGWVLGGLTMPLLAYFIRPWYKLLWAMTIPLIPLVYIFWILPESPRWLLTQNKNSQFLQLLSSAAKQNGKELKTSEISLFMSSIHEKNTDERTEKTILDLVKHPVSGKRTLYMAIIWFIGGFVYYSLSYNTNDLAGNPYINFFISNAIDLFAVIAVYLSARFLGRKPTLITGMILCGLMYTIIIFLPQKTLWIIIFAMIGKFGVTVAFNNCYLYTSELSPTVVRNVALGSCSSSARAGSMLAPFVRELDKATHYAVPHALNAALAILASLIGFLLPETRGRQIDDVLDQTTVGTEPSTESMDRH